MRRIMALRARYALCLLAVFAACGENDPIDPSSDAGNEFQDAGGGNDGGAIVNMDGDQDGIDDDFERAHGLDPTRNDAAEDKDGDGLTNLDEFNRGTLPEDLDTDDDGLSDGAETTTDPKNRDSDGD